MKKKVLYAAAFVFIAWAATACEALNDCKFCKTVTTDTKTGEVTEGSEIEYCGATLIAIEAKGTTKVGDLETVYECR
jgi:hypothetical protein